MSCKDGLSSKAESFFQKTHVILSIQTPRVLKLIMPIYFRYFPHTFFSSLSAPHLPINQISCSQGKSTPSNRLCVDCAEVAWSDSGPSRQSWQFHRVHCRVIPWAAPRLLLGEYTPGLSWAEDASNCTEWMDSGKKLDEEATQETQIKLRNY